jgi:DNA-binding transcriptional ArsR family regulator
MPGQKANLILHPIRFRIVTAIAAYKMTTKEIADLMPEIPLTTLYRHINILVEAGLMNVVDEKQIRGTIERTYALTAPPSLIADDLEGMTRQEAEQYFTMFLSSLMSDSQRYLDGKPESSSFNPIKDGVQISKVQLFLDEQEFQKMNLRIQEILVEAVNNEPGLGRKRRMFSYLMIPLGGEERTN